MGCHHSIFGSFQGHLLINSSRSSSGDFTQSASSGRDSAHHSLRTSFSSKTRSRLLQGSCSGGSIMTLLFRNSKNKKSLPRIESRKALTVYILCQTKMLSFFSPGKLVQYHSQGVILYTKGSWAQSVCLGAISLASEEIELLFKYAHFKFPKFWRMSNPKVRSCHQVVPCWNGLTGNNKTPSLHVSISIRQPKAIVVIKKM